ncbi:hypothetical protein LWI29_001670 [Acer saccharum]|uniref:Uncharacterized protein n=1 Tax=Acer saccharum TaxID=4024 RepID=A0AA39SEC6_ACESA|nr:hypothetical protein LWI29_001670 [Acer saccharum]
MEEKVATSIGRMVEELRSDGLCLAVKDDRRLVDGDSKEDELPGLKNSVTPSSNTPIEVEQSGFEVELTGKNFEQNHDQLQVHVQSVNDSDEVVVQHDDIEDYNLTRDRVRREVRAPYRFGYADIVAYALQVTG